MKRTLLNKGVTTSDVSNLAVQIKKESDALKKRETRKESIKK